MLMFTPINKPTENYYNQNLGSGYTGWGSLNSKSTASIALGNIATGTLTAPTITKCGNVCVCSAYISNMSGIADRTNFKPFAVPSGYRPFQQTAVTAIISFSGGNERATYLNAQSSGDVVGNYIVTGSEAPNVTGIRLSAVWFT